MIGEATISPWKLCTLKTTIVGHPHLHVLITCGAWTAEGEFLELPEFDLERLLFVWQDAVFELYLAEEKIEPEVVENMRSFPNIFLPRART